MPYFVVMKKSMKNKLKCLAATLMVVLYAFVFMGSSYLHHHHEKSNHASATFSEDNSCDLCDASPAKLFNMIDSFTFEFIDAPFYLYSNYIQDKAQNCSIYLHNKAPPALA